jgi:hypothetical protein
MSRKSHRLISGIVLMAATILPISVAFAQAPTLPEQLAAQYKLVKMGSDTSGYSVVEKGTLLAIQKGGILAVPYGDQNILANKYEGGTIHAPSGLSLMGRKSIMGKFGKEQTTHLFAVGDKVYPMKIDVNVAKDTVTVGIVACDTCNKTDPPTYNKANVVFQFPKGSLAAADGLAVEKVVGQVLLISDEQDDKGGDKAADKGGDQQQGAQDQGQGQGQQAAEQPAAEPASIEKGMSPDQVEAAMGKPEKKVTLGAKQIYYYKDMKVIFMNGKVSDVQ